MDARVLGPDEGEVVGDRPGRWVALKAEFPPVSGAPARFLNLHAPDLGFAERMRSGDAQGFDQHPPPADGGPPAAAAVVRAPGEGEVKAGREHGGGFFAVTETTLTPGGEAAESRRDAVRILWGLEGTLAVRLDDDVAAVGPGSCAVVPAGPARTPANLGDAPVRFLDIVAPVGSEPV